jgi:cysteine desulfurase
MTLGRRGHIITPDIEHAAVLESAQNYENTQIATQNNGLVNLDLLEKSVRDNTILLSVAAANNETGTVQSLAAIAEIVKKIRLQRQAVGNPQPLYLHSDASQAAGLLDLHVSRLGVDLLTLNSGKVYGPKQVGLLWKSSEINLEPLIFGGGQEMELRSGTENVAGIIGFAAALQDAEKKRSSETKRLAALRDTLQKALLTKFPNAEIIGSQKKRLPNFLTIAFPGLDAERVLFLLENKGVFVATGSACAANKATRSHVLTALGLPEKTIDGSLRFTLGRQTSEETLDFALPKIITAINSEYARQQK